MLLMVAVDSVEGVAGFRLTMMFVGGLMLLFLYEWVAFPGWRRLASWVGDSWCYRVTDDGVGVHTPRSDFTLRWEAVAKVRVTPDAWVARTTSKVRVPIPRAAFTEADADQVDQALTSRTGAARP